MKITHCKLKKSIQKKLLDFFILEVTTRAAADLLGIQANSAILFYRKIREVISYHLALEANEIFDAQIELDESYFGGHRKRKTETLIPESQGKSSLIAGFMPIPIGAMMLLM